MSQMPVKTAAKPKTTRIRKKVYGERITVSLRLEPAVHKALMRLCTKEELIANKYITSLIERDLIDKKVLKRKLSKNADEE